VPQRALRKCREKGCRTLHRNADGYCDQHKKNWSNKQAPASARGYDHKWQQFRKRFLAARPLCERCKKAGITKGATHVHHLVPLADGGKRLDPSNCQALCHLCHDIVHGRRKG